MLGNCTAAADNYTEVVVAVEDYIVAATVVDCYIGAAAADSYTAEKLDIGIAAHPAEKLDIGIAVHPAEKMKIGNHIFRHQ